MHWFQAVKSDYLNVQNVSGIHAAAYWKGTVDEKLTAHRHLVSTL